MYGHNFNLVYRTVQNLFYKAKSFTEKAIPQKQEFSFFLTN